MDKINTFAVEVAGGKPQPDPQMLVIVPKEHIRRISYSKQAYYGAIMGFRYNTADDCCMGGWRMGINWRMYCMCAFTFYPEEFRGESQGCMWSMKRGSLLVVVCLLAGACSLY